MSNFIYDYFQTELNQMLLCKELDLKKIISKVRNALKRHTSMVNSRHMESRVDLAIQVLSCFILCIWSQSFSSPSKNCCHALFSWTKHNGFGRGVFSHLCLFPTARPRCPVPHVVEGWHSRTVSRPHSIGKASRMRTPDS